MPPTTPSNIRSTIDAIWRRESASLMSVVRNLSLAEDLTHLESSRERGSPAHALRPSRNTHPRHRPFLLHPAYFGWRKCRSRRSLIVIQ